MSREIHHKDYLGDSVYVHFDGWNVVLETRNGGPEDPSNVIALEPEVLVALMRYALRIGAIKLENL